MCEGWAHAGRVRLDSLLRALQIRAACFIRTPSHAGKGSLVRTEFKEPDTEAHAHGYFESVLRQDRGNKITQNGHTTVSLYSHLGATKALAPAAQAIAMTADFILMFEGGEEEGACPWCEMWE